MPRQKDCNIVRDPEDLLTKEFMKTVNKAAIEAAQHQGKVLKPHIAGRISDALKPEYHSQFSTEALNIPILFASKINNNPFAGFATGQQDEKQILIMHPEQAWSSYVPGFLHELKHIEDIIEGRPVTPTEGIPYNQAIRLASERRARKAEIICKKE